MAEGTPAGRPVAVYRLYDSRGELLYVGASVDPENRLRYHTSGMYRTHWADAVDHSAVAVTWYPTRGAANAAELLAIQVEQPAHNVQGAVPGYGYHPSRGQA